MRTLALVGLCLGVLIGFAVSFSPPAEATRNSSGTYSLPSGNPVSTGTTITSSWANTTLSDLASELTNSLDRQGRGAMQAPLQLSSGTSNLPGLTFSGDTDTGIYRSTANTMHAVAGATAVQDWDATGVSVNGTLDVSGATSVSGATTMTGALTINSGATPLVLKAGAADHTYLQFFADSDNPNTRTGYFGFTGAANPDIGLVNEMSGGDITLNAGSSGTLNTNANVVLTGANPASSSGFTETITPMNIIKAWGRLNLNGAGAVVVDAGFNISSASISSSSMTVTLASAMASSTYSPFLTVDGLGTPNRNCLTRPTATTTFEITCLNPSTGSLVDLATQDITINFLVLGAQ